MDGQYLPDDEIDIDSLASSEPPEYVPQMFSHGGEVEEKEEDIEHYAKGGEASFDSQTEAMNKYLLAEEEGAMPTAYATATQPTESTSPTAGATTAKAMLKKMTKGSGGKSKRPKEMDLEISGLSPAIPELGAPQTEQEKLTQIATARAQYDALERAYKLKAQAAQRAGRGLMKPTFSTQAFDQPTLEKPGPLMARTFQAGGLVRALKSGAKKGASSVDNVVPSSARSLFPEEGSSFLPSIIKEEGGNWMGGSTSPEAFVTPLYKAENLDNPNKAKALNKWIDKKLTPYIKNKMGTPSDPVRKLADEEGILPIARPVPLEAQLLRDRAAFNRSVVRGMDQSAPSSKTAAGQTWENLTDSAIEVGTYRNMIPGTFRGQLALTPDSVEGELRKAGGDFAVQNPNATVSGMKMGDNTGYSPRNFGFDHIVDVLQEDLTTGRLGPDSLRGLSIEDAVRRTFEYDQEMAKKMREASIQTLKDVPVYKAYPEQGFKWMQLDKPGYFAAESDAMGHSVRGYEPPVGHPDWTPQSGNKGSLGYGSGGWEAIKSGDVKVYSLADDTGKRYTTVEAVPSAHPLSISGRGNDFPNELRYGGSGTGVEGNIPEEKLQEIYALGKKMYFENPNAYAENRLLTGARTPSAMDSFQKAADMVLGKMPPTINQIKGPVNGYLEKGAQPFVQDFLNSGNWSTVNDLHLAKLKDVTDDNPRLENYIKSIKQDNRRFLTEAEYKKYETDFLRDELKGQLGGFDPLAPSPVERARGSPIGGEQRLTPQQIERLAADQVELNTYQPVMNRNIQRQGAKSRKLATERDINQLPDPQTYAFIESALLGTPPDEVANKFSVFHPKRKEILGRAEQGFVAGNVALVGPAARMLKEVTAPAVKYLGKEAARQVERGMFNEGPLRAITPQPAFAVRPEGGGTTFTNIREGGSSAPISKLDKLIETGANPRIDGLSDETGDAIENFWRSKAQNFFTRQYGTPSDPIFKQIISGQLSTPTLQRSIPDYAIEQTRVGKTRIDPVTGESRFYPKYPQALEDLTRRYDELTGLKGIAFNVKEPIFDPAYPTTMGDRGRQLESALREDVTEKMVAGGLNPSLINTNIGLTGPKGEGSSDLLNYVPGEYKELYSMYTNPPKDPGAIRRIYDELGLTSKPNEPVPDVVPENLRRAIQTSEPIYDVDLPYRSPLRDLFAPDNINRYLATLSPADIGKMRFEDVVKNSARYNLDMFNTQNLVDAIKSGKRVPDKVWSQGLSEPLMSFQKEGAKEGEKFTWHRIVDNEATAVEGAYIGHSVGGYAKGGSYGPKEYRRFKEGEKEVYTLRDPRGKPFTTVEIEKTYTGPLDRTLDERDIARMKAEGRDLGPVKTIVRQIKGNGAKTGNVAPKDVDEEVLSFLRDYIKPDKITESDSYLTPKLEEFKMDLSGRPRP